MIVAPVLFSHGLPCHIANPNVPERKDVMNRNPLLGPSSSSNFHDNVCSGFPVLKSELTSS